MDLSVTFHSEQNESLKKWDGAPFGEDTFMQLVRIPTRDTETERESGQEIK
jgi:hypothetical protein